MDAKRRTRKTWLDLVRDRDDTKDLETIYPFYSFLAKHRLGDDQRDNVRPIRRLIGSMLDLVEAREHLGGLDKKMRDARTPKEKLYKMLRRADRLCDDIHGVCYDI
jgi:hypothetical protein